MKRVLRSGIYVAAGMSILLLTMLAVLWVRSRWSTDSVQFVSADGTLQVGAVSIQGRVCWVYSKPSGSVPFWLERQPGWTYRAVSPIFLETLLDGRMLTTGLAGFNLAELVTVWERHDSGYSISSQPRSNFESQWSTPIAIPAGATFERAYWFIIPHWMIIVAILPLPAYCLIKRIRSRHPPGHCAKCGYDLRATPDRCPECGAVPETAKGAVQ